MLTATLLGCGGTQPLPHRALASLALTAAGRSLLIDCGEGTQAAAMRAGVRGWMVAWYLAGRAAVQGRVAKASLAVREASRVRAASPLLKMLFFVFIILCFKLHLLYIMSGLLSYSTYTFTVRVSGLPTSRTM